MADQGIQDGVQVNLVNPGTVRTARFQNPPQCAGCRKKLDPPRRKKPMCASRRVTHIGEPEDIAALVAFILSSEGSFMQGSLVDMDGGSTKSL